MSNVVWMVAEKEGEKVVTVYIDGEQYIASQSNPSFKKITEKLFEKDFDGLVDLFSADKVVEKRFKKISERVSVSGGQVYFDNDPIESALSEHLMRLIHNAEDEDDMKYLLNFWEKISANPSEHSRESLMRWLEKHDFSITEQGDIVAYKGLRKDFTSIHPGPGIVDGVALNGHLPNKVGSIVEISRDSVVQDKFQGCAFGLHVGTYDYAKAFGYGTTVEVSVNPRDVVSVPTDAGDAKVRVCRYKVERVKDGSEGVRTEAVVRDFGQVDNDFEPTPETNEVIVTPVNVTNVYVNTVNAETGKSDWTSK